MSHAPPCGCKNGRRQQGVLERAVGPLVEQCKVEAEKWAALMGRKRRWPVREHFIEQQTQQFDQGSVDVHATRRRVLLARHGTVLRAGGADGAVWDTEALDALLEMGGN